VTLRKVVSSLSRDRRQSRPKVAITFDDGYFDNYQYAYPLLVRNAVPATFFLTVGLLEGDPKVVERFGSLRQAQKKEIEPLAWDQVQEMSEAGMEVGCHTYSHRNLAFLQGSELEFELRNAKEIMEKRLEQEIAGLAYPFGKPRRHFNKTTVEEAQNAGYQYGAAVCLRGVKDGDLPWALPRFLVTEDSLEVLSSKINGAWDLLGYSQERTPLWLARLISPKDFSV
jgi:peptidoglycan/xylan/chitin deacetylase (PgdA/CDA1 family)